MNYDYCNGTIHVIEKGDSLYKISRQHGVPLALILMANPYSDIYNLQIGDEICVPLSVTDNSSVMPMPVPSPMLVTEPAPTENVVPPSPIITIPSLQTEENNQSGQSGLFGQNTGTTNSDRIYMNDNYTNGIYTNGNYANGNYMISNMAKGSNGTSLQMMSYLVKENDSLGSILKNNNIEMEDFLRYNDLIDIMLKPGTTVMIPIRR